MNLHRKAKRLPRQPGPAAWNRLLPSRPTGAALEAREVVDIAIIGAGFAGLSAARQLSKLDKTLDVAVLEAGLIAEGPAGRNSGFMIDIPHDLSSDDYTGGGSGEDRAEIERNRFAIRFAEVFAEECDLPVHVFNRCGKVNASASAGSDDRNRKYAARLSAMAEDHSLLDTAQMREMTGTDFYRSGLYTPGTAILQPAAYIRALADSLGAGPQIYESSPVMELIQQPDSWLLKTPGGEVAAKRVILANNGHAESFGFFSRRLVHVFTYASMTEAFSPELLGGSNHWAVTPTDPMGTTVRRINDGERGDRIVVRSRFTYNPSMTVGSSQLANAGKLHDQKFRDRFPMLDNLPMAFRWAGHLCLSRNGVPAHGEIANGVYSAVCQNGLGLAKGTLSGMSAAELSMGRESEITRSLSGTDAPSRLPPEPLAWIGANALMRWKEWRAGAE